MIYNKNYITNSFKWGNFSTVTDRIREDQQLWFQAKVTDHDF